jgi:hypothetical protein
MSSSGVRQGSPGKMGETGKFPAEKSKTNPKRHREPKQRNNQEKCRNLSELLQKKGTGPRQTHGRMLNRQEATRATRTYQSRESEKTSQSFPHSQHKPIPKPDKHSPRIKLQSKV